MANFNQTWHYAYLGNGDPCVWKDSLRPFSREDINLIAKINDEI